MGLTDPDAKSGRLALVDNTADVVAVEVAAGMSTRIRRDAITGEKLTDEHGRRLPTCGDYFLRVRDERIEHRVTLAERASGLESETTPIPRAIDTAQPYPGGKLGGKRWYPEFTRYLGAVDGTAAQIRADQEDLGAWWHSAYARQRVRRGFIAHYGSERRGVSAYRYALAALVAPELLEDWATGAGHSLSWLIRQRSLAYRFAFAKSSAA